MKRVMSVFFLTTFLASLLFSQVERREQGNLIIEGIPEIPASIEEKMIQYQNVRSAFLQDWLPSGRGMLISTRFGETSQIHWVNAPGAARRQITFFPEPVGGAEVSTMPGQNGFIFSKDVGGSEFYQLFYFDLDDGSYKMLTDGESRNGGGIWSNKGDRFAFTSTKRNGRDFDIYIATIGQPEQAEMIGENSGAWYIVDWSPDDTHLLTARYVSINESYLYTLDLATGESKQLNPTDKKIGYGWAVWAKDGKGIYYSSDEDTEFRHLRYYDLATGASTMLTADIPWDVNFVTVSPDGRLYAFVANEDGISKLYLRDTATHTPVSLPEIPVGQIYGLRFNPDSKTLGLTINTPQTPGDIYAVDIEKGELTRWTYSEVGGLNTDNFVVPELLHYATFDSVEGKPRQIPAFVYKPKKVGAAPLPVLVSIHGGPEGQYRPFFSWNFQYLINELGIAIVAPNVRGSAGYGKSYLKLDNGFKREDSVKDIGKLLDWIDGQPDLDASRIAVMGGSYGGYMVLASMVHYNDRLRCGVDIVGISNFVTFLENTQSYRRDLRRAEYGDERDPKMREHLNNISPNNHAHKITKPMLIAQGLNDPRVPASESEQMLEVIRENGGLVWYLLAKDEGHGFRKKSNRDYYYNSVALFLETFLLTDGQTSMR